MKRLLAATLVAAFATYACADSVYFVSDTGGHELYSMDLTTMNVTTVGALGIDGTNGTFGDLAYDSTNGTMYYSGGRGDENLYTVNLTTGAATLVGSDGQTDMFALGYDPATNSLYGGAADSHAFGSVSMSNGAFTFIGTAGSLYTEGLTYNSLTSQMILSSPNELFNIDVVTAGTTLIGNVGGSNDNGITYDPVRNVYWIYNYNGNIVEQNATTFAVIQTLSPGVGDGSSIAYVGAPAPEPASMALLGLGALGLLRRARKSR